MLSLLQRGRYPLARGTAGRADPPPLAPRARAALGDVGAAELSAAVLLAGVFWLPPLAGGKAWPVVLAAMLMLAAYRLARERRAPPVPVFLVVFLVGYAIAALHGGSVTLADLAHHFVRPLIAIGVAALVVRPSQRLRVLVLIVVFCLSEVPFTAVQAVENVVRYGRGATIGADGVTGSLGASQAGTVGLVGFLGAALAAAAWLSGSVRLRVAGPVVLALLAIPVFSGMRSAVFFAALVGVAMVVVSLTFAPRPARVRLTGLLAVSIALSPAMYGAIRAIYPSAFVGMFSSQQASVLGGAPALGIPASTTSPSPSGEGRGSAKPARPALAPSAGTATTQPTPVTPPAPTGVELLPGRADQIKTAYHLSLADGVSTALLGRGLGTSTLDPRWRRAQDVPLPERTGFTWIGLLLTETGWLGLSLFAGLLAWLVLMGYRLWQRAEAASERALAAALPGLAALTALGAAFTTILQVRTYSIVFWMLVGLAISASRDARVRTDSGRGSTGRSLA